MKKCTKNRIWSKAVAIVLVFVMAFLSPTRTFAASNTYIKDIKLVSAESASVAGMLVGKGYSVLSTPIYTSEKNANGNTYVAYQTTSNPEEAITDIRAMNMNGGWSYDKYEEFLKEEEEAIELMLTDLVIAIKEFRSNYAAGKDSAIYAYNILQTYIEDDTGMLLGDFMLKNALENHDQLATLMLQCNADVFTLIEQNLMIACQGTLEGTYAQRLSATDVYEYADSKEYLGASKQIISGLEELQQAIRAYENSGYVFGVQDDDVITKWLEGTSNENVRVWAEGQYLYDLLKACKYQGMDGEETLYDLFMNHTTSKDINGDIIADFDPNVFNAAAAMMSDGQLAMLKLVGLKKFFLMEAQNANAYTNGSEFVDKLGLLDGIEEVSVYEGVDRSIFDAEGIAMTSAAMQQIAAGNETAWAQRETRENFDYALKMTMIASGGVGALGALGVGIVAYSKIMAWGITREVTNAVAIGPDLLITPIVDVSSQGEAFIAGYVTTTEAVTESAPTSFFANLIPTIKGSGFLTALSGITLVAIGVMLIALCVWLIVTLIEDSSVPEWLDIPRKIMNEVEVDGEKQYIYYDGVRRASRDAQSGEELNNGQFMDVGNWEDESRYRQWVAIYTTKDRRAGQPILAKGFAVASQPNTNVGFLQLKKFNETSAYNLTTYCSTAKSYINYKVDTRYNPTATASTFVDNMTLAFGGGGLVLGLVGGLLIGTKSRKKKEANA